MLLITGATGHVGIPLLYDLAERGVPTRVLVRDLAKTAALPATFERHRGDLEDAGSLDAAFDGVDRLFLLTQGTGTAMARNALRAAERARVGHVVLLSSTNVFGDPVPAMGRWHHERETLVKASGLAWTILRPNGFMSNALEWRSTLAREGVVLDATGPGRHAVIDPADIAAVTAAVLTEPGHVGAEYTLTGPESLTTAEQALTLARVLGRQVPLREVGTPEDAVRSRYPDGAPAPLAEAVIQAWSLMRADTVGARTHTVELLTGRSPRTFEAWCRRHASAFADAFAAA
jgi:uncharacterized protein YbjT (DUF2867 family)